MRLKTVRRLTLFPGARFGPACGLWHERGEYLLQFGRIDVVGQVDVGVHLVELVAALHTPKQMTLRNALIEPELVEQTPLLVPPSIILASKAVIHGFTRINVWRRSQAFFDSIDPERT